MGRRVLVTGADTFWGGRVIQNLESASDVDVILGLGTGLPSVPFERAEFVRADQAYSILHRIVRAAQVDTVIHTFLVVDSTRVSARALHEINVIGTMNLLAAAGAPDSKVRHLIMKSSTMVYGSSPKDPAMFLEDTPRASPPHTRMERSLVEAEALVRDFSEDAPDTVVTVLRFGNVLGADIVTPISRNLARPLCPAIFGFDPLLQFLEEEDVTRALEFVTHRRLPGVFNVAGPGTLPWSEVVAMCGTRRLFLSPVQTRRAAAPLIRLGLVDLPPELDHLLRFGRGVDIAKLVAAGFEYHHTSAGAVRSFVRALRLRRNTRRPPESYIYEHDVEQFFRHSPSVASTDG